ncbi:MAG TPA: aldo/keto reductase [Bryobacteraceae bacterium]|nr:aldo/keto reductase [Bryobacteraceae bacterium]
MHATAEGAERYVGRFPALRRTGFYRAVFDLEVSSLGIGTYLGSPDDAADHAYVAALLAGAENGINFFDTAINYRHQRSERAIGAALRELSRDEFVVCTKAGFLTPGAVPASLRPEDVFQNMHSMAPHFLADQIERSRGNLGVDTIDIFYLHNPETQLGGRPIEEFEAAIRCAFAELERQVEQGRIRWYGAATWNGFRMKGALSLPRLAAMAIEVGGPEHHFRFIQLPFNMGMVEAYTTRPDNVLTAAAGLGIAVVASATLSQSRVLSEMPAGVAKQMPGLTTNAQRAIQFTRSTPGISVALVGMGRPEHVMENLGVAKAPPLGRESYERLYRQ